MFPQEKKAEAPAEEKVEEKAEAPAAKAEAPAEEKVEEKAEAPAEEKAKEYHLFLFIEKSAKKVKRFATSVFSITLTFSFAKFTYSIALF